MTQQEIEYVSYRLARAEESLEEAELLLRSGHANSAVNRLYYACFYAVSGLLYTEGDSSTKHAGVIALFDRHWIKTQRLPKSLGRFYHGLFDRRQESDYGDLVDFDIVDVAQWLEDARGFVEIVSTKVKEMIGPIPEG